MLSEREQRPLLESIERPAWLLARPVRERDREIRRQVADEAAVRRLRARSRSQGSLKRGTLMRRENRFITNLLNNVYEKNSPIRRYHRVAMRWHS